MNKINNLENTLVIAPVNDNYYGRKVFCMFHVKEQDGDVLEVNNLWCMDYPDSVKGEINSFRNSVKQIKTDDIWVFANSITEQQKVYFQKLELEYRFHKDDKALERLASKIGMDLTTIGYDEENEEGTWFTCCRIDSYTRKIIPDGLYVYSLRASDEDDSQPASIEEKVMVNHYGDILTDKPLQVPIELEVENIEYDTEGNIIS